eukprot:s5318_g3.t1
MSDVPSGYRQLSFSASSVEGCSQSIRVNCWAAPSPALVTQKLSHWCHQCHFMAYRDGNWAHHDPSDLHGWTTGSGLSELLRASENNREIVSRATSCWQEAWYGSASTTRHTPVAALDGEFPLPMMSDETAIVMDSEKPAGLHAMIEHWHFEPWSQAITIASQDV